MVDETQAVCTVATLFLHALAAAVLGYHGLRAAEALRSLRLSLLAAAALSCFGHTG